MELLDDTGYPTDHALTLISTWDYRDPKGWFDFIKPLWLYSDFGFWGEHCKREYGLLVYNYNISTAGWSGNEDIIRAMQENHILWSFYWYESRRGGHYIFTIKVKDETREHDLDGTL